MRHLPRRALVAAVLAPVLFALLPPASLAHGIQGRADLPIPISVFFWAAGGVLVVSFLALAALWSSPRWSQVSWRPAPGLTRLATSRWLLWPARTMVLLLTVGVLGAAAFGTTQANDNIAPLTVWVVWWVGLVPVSVLLGNVWRALNPWATLARLARVPPRRGDGVPAWLGVWPAFAGLLVFVWFELVYPAAASPRLLAWLIGVYTLVTLAGMLRYGVEEWLDSGEAFSVYSGLLARLSPFEVRSEDGRPRVGLRPPVVGTVTLEARAGIVPLIGLLIGSVSFDGFSRSQFWIEHSQTASGRLLDAGLGSQAARVVVGTIGLVAILCLVVGAFYAASLAAERIGGLSRHWSGGRIGHTFVHSLLPIAVAYAVAHYFSLFVFQSQDLVRLASDPYGNGSDLFGTRDFRIDYLLVSANAIWIVQVAAIVGGHILGLILAHDRALQASTRSSRAVLSQYPMLALMVLYTVSGLWFLSEGMSG